VSDELAEVFVAEGRELLDQAGEALAALRRAPGDGPALERLFRAFHTLKGSAALMGFGAMAQVFHAAEDRLSAVRAGQGALDASLADALVALADQTEAWLDETAATGAAPASGAAGALLAQLGSAPTPELASPSAGPPDFAHALTAAPGLAPGRYVAVRYVPGPDAYFRGEDPLGMVAALPGLAGLEMALRTPAGDLEGYDPFACNLVLSALSTAPEGQVRAAFRLVPDEVTLAAVEVAAAAEAAPPQRTLRVDATRIDELGAAADELAVIKNRLAHLAAQAAARLPPALARDLARAQGELDREVLRLHGAVTRLRVTPLGPLFRRFPRLVRETAAALGKEVELTLAGGDVELDKTIVDGLFEPLLHLMRNALDHGIEPPDARRAAGKPLPARLRLSASTSGEHALIELSDDGRGIELARVRAAASERGLVDPEALAAMSEAAVAELIFAPGFSTAREVGALSGRGVGLDAVRAAVAALGGRVSVRSEARAGTTVTIAAPLNVRLARIMTVRAGEEIYGVPLEAVVETVRVPTDSLTPVRAGRAFVWREQAVPLVELADLLRLPPPGPREETRVLIVKAGDELAAVAVDAFGERLEAPLRPMRGLLAGAPGMAGATLLGDGRVLMVLDLPELIG
jgi:two-component system chemotaxis sensor kinase CheA